MITGPQVKIRESVSPWINMGRKRQTMGGDDQVCNAERPATGPRHQQRVPILTPLAKVEPNRGH